MKTSLGRMLALTVACAAVALAMAAPAAHAAEVACTNITGSGSSLQGVAQSLWSTGFGEGVSVGEPKCKETSKGKFTYVTTSSGKGMNCWGATEGEFNEKAKKECGTPGILDDEIGTDVGPEGPAGTAGTQIANINKAGTKEGTEKNAILTLPVAQSAITVMVSMPAGCNPVNPQGKPKIQAKELEEEWLSGGHAYSLAQLVKITGGWQGTTCQLKEQQLYARSKPSGTTAGFKRFLAKIQPNPWAEYTNTAEKSESTEWPNQQIKTTSEKASELVEKTYTRPNSTGYADLADARKGEFPLVGQLKLHATSQGKIWSFIVEVQNGGIHQGETAKFEKPEASNGEANCSNVTYQTPGSPNALNVDWSRATEKKPLELEENGGEYPICTLTFQVAYSKYELAGFANPEPVANTVFTYLKYITKTGQELAALKQEHFAPLPTTLRTEVNEAVNTTNLKK